MISTLRDGEFILKKRTWFIIVGIAAALFVLVVYVPAPEAYRPEATAKRMR